ncbi:RHS repeat-associated core domain-containing protein [Candidatus Woesearchaeota archaeon]|nr:RHS repeat-associated core domain-containing protein [Candidatus Woesearchaeota archaeon]
MNNKALAGKWPLLLICALFAALLTTTVASLPIGSCSPNSCPEGYMDGGVSCADGTCTRICVAGECGGTPTTVYTKETNLDDFDQHNIDSVEMVIPLGTFTPTANDKCYVFRQTTPGGFISSSDIDDYDDLHDFDSAIALFWETDSSKWYDNQHFYCSGESSQFTSGSVGAVWIDSDYDNGDDFDSADSLSQTNYLYCAPNSKACGSLNGNCDTDCYGKPTSLRMSLNADLQNNFDTHSFGDFCNDDDGEDSPVIDYVNFDNDLVHMYVDEYELVNKQNDNQQCEYWPECNPADPCCASDGHFRPSGYTCKSAHNVQCLTANSAGCGGVAYEDRCTGTSSSCPDNNFEVDYDKACDDATCVEQSCSGSTLQPQRTCSAGACQKQATYACPYNLGCTDAKSCKTAAVSQGDCSSGATYDANLKICYEKGGDEHNLSYDKNGNLAGGLGLEYVYDSFNQLTAIKDSATGMVKEEYTYDHNGDRRKKVTYNSDGATTTVYYASGNFIQTVNSTGVYNETYYFLNGKLVGEKTPDKSMLFFHPDHLGSTRLVTDSSANVVADLSYKPFGELIDNAKERFLYTGKELDSSGNYYLGARYLDPAQLYAFTQPDLNIPDIYNPQDLNRYSYARNNPYRYTDPTGETAWDVTADPAFFFMALNDYEKDPNLINSIDLVASSVGLLPVLPSLGLITRSIKNADKAPKSFKKFVNWLLNNKKGSFNSNPIKRAGEVMHKGDSPIWKELTENAVSATKDKQMKVDWKKKLAYKWDKTEIHVEVYEVNGDYATLVFNKDPISGKIISYADPKKPRRVEIK